MSRLWVWLSGVGVGVLLTSWVLIGSRVEAGNLLGEQPTYGRDQGRTSLFFYVTAGSDGAGKVEYICTADPGTATTTAKWQITRFTYDTSDRVSEIEWAGANDAFDRACSNRVSESYS